MRPTLWTPAQRKIVARLMPLLPGRPWWMFVAPPNAPCSIRNGLVMGYNHSTWRSTLPPCDKCTGCTIWALTPAEARREAGKRRLR